MGVFPSENFFKNKIMQFSPKSNFTSGFFIPLQVKKSRYFPKIIGHGPLPLAMKKSPAGQILNMFKIVRDIDSDRWIYKF
jgi:hypothetical protein